MALIKGQEVVSLRYGSLVGEMVALKVIIAAIIQNRL